MTLRSTLRCGVFFCAGALLLGSLAAAQSRVASRATTASAATAVNGLIVQLRDAPSHVELLREHGAGRGAPLADRETKRWQQVVGALRADAALLRELRALAQAPRRDPVGASAQVLRFAQPLTAAQAERAAARLAARPEVAWVVPNVRERRLAKASNPPNDPYFGGLAGQWWLQQLQGSNGNAIEGRLRGVPSFLPAWMDSSTGSAAAVVAVLDTGITPHPELAGRILPGYDFVTDSSYANDGNGRDDDPSDPGDWVSQADRNADPTRYNSCELEVSSWHGTVIAGMLAALTNNGDGAAAMNWNGRVLPVRVAGKCGAEVADIIDGMRWTAGLPVCLRFNGAGDCLEMSADLGTPRARVVNISFGGTGSCAPYQEAVDALRARGVVVVAAAGNGWTTPTRPAKCPGVVGVAALNRDGFKTNYSNFGPELTASGIATVGGDDADGAWGTLLADSGLLTIGNTGDTVPGFNVDNARYFGTSFSAPVVAGAVSLMLSVDPALTADQIVQGLTRSARPHVIFPANVPNLGLCSNANPGRCQCTTATCGAGILDVQQALLYAGNPGSYVNTRAFGDLIDTTELRNAAARGPDRPANPQLPPPSTGGGGGGGGGAMSAAWLLALALAAWGLSGPLNAVPGRARTRYPAPRR